MKKKIIFINQSSGYLMLDIIEVFKEIYDERVLITGYLNTGNRKMDNDLIIIKSSTLIRTSKIGRIYSWIVAFIKALYYIKIKYKNAHLFLVSNPPINSFLPIFCNNTFDLLIFDIYPDAFIDQIKFNRNSYIIKQWVKLNKLTFAKAKNVFTITDTMKIILTQYVSEEKIKVVHLWNDNASLKYINKNNNNFIIENKLQNKFIVQYSGNMGVSFPIELFISLAENLKLNKEIHFLLIGSGNKFKQMDTLINKSQLKNITLLPWQDKEMLSYTLSASDLSIVIADENAKVSMPSKTFNLIALGIPVIGITSENSELAYMIEKYKFGSIFTMDKVELIVSYIQHLSVSYDLQNKLKNNSLTASLNFTNTNAINFSK